MVEVASTMAEQALYQWLLIWNIHKQGGTEIWRWYVPLKHLDMLNYPLRCIMSQKTRTISVSAVKTSNVITKCWIVSFAGLWENVCRFCVRQDGLFVTVLQTQPVRSHRANWTAVSYQCLQNMESCWICLNICSLLFAGQEHTKFKKLKVYSLEQRSFCI